MILPDLVMVTPGGTLDTGLGSLSLCPLAMVLSRHQLDASL